MIFERNITERKAQAIEQEIFLSELSTEEKKVQLYLKQKRMLETFRERNAISKEQFEKSLADLIAKMGMEAYKNR